MSCLDLDRHYLRQRYRDALSRSQNLGIPYLVAAQVLLEGLLAPAPSGRSRCSPTVTSLEVAEAPRLAPSARSLTMS